LKLLEASDELCFSELIEDLQKHFINKKGDWIQQNLIYFHDFLTENQSFSLLQEYFDKLYHNYPELFLESDGMEMMEKTMLVSILERDDLKLDEIDIWNHVIRW